MTACLGVTGAQRRRNGHAGIEGTAAGTRRIRGVGSARPPRLQAGRSGFRSDRHRGAILVLVRGLALVRSTLAA